MKSVVYKANFFLAMMLFAIAGCGDDEQQPLNITVENRDALTQTVYADETPAKVTIETKGAWTSSIKEGAAKAGVSWISITPDRGEEAGKYTIAISLATNATGENRSAVITITCNGENLLINVTQKAETKDGKPIAIEVSTPQALVQTLDASQTQGESLTFTTSAAWTSSIAPSAASSWLSINPNSGAAGTHTAAITLTPNTTTADRQATIKIACDGKEITISITQKAKTDTGEPENTITMTTSDNPGEIRFYLWGSGLVTVNLLSGFSETKMLSMDGTFFSQNYSGTKHPITITISGENITEFTCYDNQLTSLDVNGCTTLTKLNCGRNQLTSLNVSGYTALLELSCDMNQLTSLSVSGCTALTKLSCDINQLTSLNVRGCTALPSLICYFQQLTSLNVDGCTALKDLYCQGNQLMSLNVSDCISLTRLNCSGNQLTSLNVSGRIHLQELFCGNNQLTSLDVSNCTAALGALGCSGNQLEDDVLNTLFGMLPVKSIENYGRIFINNNPGTSTCNRKIAQDKWWLFLD